ncbi:MAG: hypothetical protein ABIL70_09045 [candidate division WOR-3 bacterium]
MIIFFFFNLFETFYFPNSYKAIPQFNPAGAFEKDYKITVGGGESYGLPDLRTAFLITQLKNYQVNLRTFGNTFYRENLLELAGAYAIKDEFGVGFGLDFLNYWIKDNANRFTYSFKLGCLYKTPPVKIWVVLKNLNQPRFSEIDYLPVLYWVGLNYKIGKDFSFYLNIGGIENRLPFFNFGLILAPLNILQLSGGMNTENFSFEYGLEFLLGKISLGYSGSSHQQLGLTHYLNITFHHQ